MTGEQVVVGVIADLGPADLARIADSHSRVEVRHINLADVADDALAGQALGDVEVLLTSSRYWQDRRSLDGLAPRLRWVQLTNAGSDPILHLVSAGVVWTTAAGTTAGTIAESVIGSMLLFAKQYREVLDQQRRHEWTRYVPSELTGATVGIVGLGHVGREVARRARSFGCRVIASRRSGGGLHADVDELLSASALPRLLAESDYVVLTTALTAETRGLIDAEALRLMKPTAVLINVSRGAVVDEQALVDALRQGMIAGAALDVFAREPLPKDHPLWDLPNVVVTPHVSALSPLQQRRVTDLFILNLRRYLIGEPLENQVDPTRGY